MKNSLKPVATGLFLLFSLWFCSCSSNDNRNKIVEIKGEYLCISLKNYFDELSNQVASGNTVPHEMDTMYGLSWLAGYVVDYEEHDIILVGKSIPGRPVYHAEDIFVNFQNVFDSASPPYCSLDPFPENILRLNECMKMKTTDYDAKIRACKEAVGDQKVVVGGVPRNSRHAQIMIYADYDMKKISQGLITDAGIPSCIDLSASDTVKKLAGNDADATMSRFWFHIRENEEGKVYPNYLENDGIVFINECPVVLLTEKQLSDSSGNLQDSKNEEDVVANLFAKIFSDNFPKMTTRYVTFAELENLFRLQAVFLSIKFRKDAETSKVNLDCLNNLRLNPGDDGLPATLPGLVNAKLFQNTKTKGNQEYIDYQFYLVAGGVSQQMTVNELNLNNEKALKATSEIIIGSRPAVKSITWKVDLSAD